MVSVTLFTARTKTEFEFVGRCTGINFVQAAMQSNNIVKIAVEEKSHNHYSLEVWKIQDDKWTKVINNERQTTDS